MNRQRRWLLISAMAGLVSGCAGLPKPLETPSIMLDSFRLLPSEGMTPRFAIGLRVINPNPTPLPLRGVSYSAGLEGRRLLSGVAGDLRTVPAYGEELIELQAGLDLLSGLQFLSDLLNQTQREAFSFNVQARLDTGGRMGFLTLDETGEISLAGLRR